MNLPFLKNFRKKIIPLYFLVLVLRDEKAQAVIFEETEGVAKIIGQREEHFSTSIDEISQEELLQKLDKAISSAESPLPENIQTQKTIFGVKESWTDHDQIKKEYLLKLKKTSEELELIPIGFLVISQAISHLLQKEEGVPISAILVEINEKNVIVTLLRAGKSIETKSSEIHDSIPFTVDTLLKHFSSSEILPSRIILFNGKKDLSQEFISHAWSKSLPFLHLPQITNLPYGFDSKAVLFGAATQMGFAILEKDMPKGQSIRSESPEEIQALNEDLPENETQVISKNLGAQNFGFAQDVDIAKMEFEEAPENLPEKEEQSLVSPDEAGEMHPIPKSPNKFKSFLIFIKNIPVAAKNFTFAFGSKLKTKGATSRMLYGKLSILFPAILIIIAALIASYFIFLKATVTITLEPKISEHAKSVIFSTSKATDPSNNIIKGQLVSISGDGSVSTPATGKKEVGTNAKGSVTIFNSLTESKTLRGGTVLRSPNGLEFTLDSQITINAVASHSADETVTPEKVTANVTAAELGKEFNLPSGTKFSVDSFDTSEVISKNDNPFSGGTRKEITVISKNDLVNLGENLIRQLEDKAKQDLQNQLGQDAVLLPDFVAKNLSRQSLNAKVGDEANQLTLTGTVKYQGISYAKNELLTFIKSFLSENIPSDQEIDYNNIKTTVLSVQSKNIEELNANLNIKALLLPKIDKIKLVRDIKGKSVKTSSDLIYKLPQIADVTIKLSPNLPFLPKNLPSREENIKIIINP